MTYKQTVNWMYSQLPMYQKQGKTAYKENLDNVLLLSKKLNHPEKRIKTIHVAGTNGKGSSCHMLSSVLQESGYKVGLFTSPHLKDFRERIKINGKEVSQQYVISFIEKYQSFLKNNELSFFEMTVGMALSYFEEQKVDIAVIEVGLGGRLDSTNIITPEISLITNIGLDHTNILGNTISEITFEKAGIIKSNVPVVISEYQNETDLIFKEVAKQRNARIIFAHTEVTKYKTDLLGNYQLNNIQGVVSVLKNLKEFNISNNHIKNGLLSVSHNTGFKGRWSVINDVPKVIVDTAHNKEGLEIVLNQLKKETFKHLHIVLGVVNDKKLETILPLFPKNAKYYFCSPKNDRGLDEKKLQSVALGYGLNGNGYTSVSVAYRGAIANSDEADLIYIGGSTFVVAEII